VDFVKNNVSEERIAPIMRVTRIVFLRSVHQLLVTPNAVPSSRIATFQKTVFFRIIFNSTTDFDKKVLNLKGVNKDA
jgi:hypothetical protein